MKRYLTYFLLISSIFSQDGNLVVSILDLQGEDVSQKVLRACFQRLETSLIQSNRFTVIEKGEREEILKEQEFQASGVCDDACAVEIGQLVGAEYLVLGEVLEFPGLYQIDLKIVNVEKGDIAEKVTDEIEGDIEGEGLDEDAKASDAEDDKDTEASDKETKDEKNKEE